MKINPNLYILPLLLISLSFTHAEEPKKEFEANGYTHAENEVEPTDWTNPDVLEWCTDVEDKLRANCLRIIPSESIKVDVQGVEYLLIPLRSHLFFKDNPWSGTLWYYGFAVVNPAKNNEIMVTLDEEKTVYSTTGEGIMRVFAGLETPNTYTVKMELLLKSYLDRSLFFSNLLKTDADLLKLIKEINDKPKK